MGKSCVVGGCSNTSQEGFFSLHLFPKHEPARTRWADRVKNTRAKWNGPTEYSAICSAHFKKEDFEELVGQHFSACGLSPLKRRFLKQDAIPSLFGQKAKQNVSLRPTENENEGAGPSSRHLEEEFHFSNPVQKKRSGRAFQKQHKRAFDSPGMQESPLEYEPSTNQATQNQYTDSSRQRMSITQIRPLSIHKVETSNGLNGIISQEMDASSLPGITTSEEVCSSQERSILPASSSTSKQHTQDASIPSAEVTLVVASLQVLTNGSESLLSTSSASREIKDETNVASIAGKDSSAPKEFELNLSAGRDLSSMPCVEPTLLPSIRLCPFHHCLTAETIVFSGQPKILALIKILSTDSPPQYRLLKVLSVDASLQTNVIAPQSSSGRILTCCSIVIIQKRRTFLINQKVHSKDVDTLKKGILPNSFMEESLTIMLLTEDKCSTEPLYLLPVDYNCKCNVSTCTTSSFKYGSEKVVRSMYPAIGKFPSEVTITDFEGPHLYHQYSSRDIDQSKTLWIDLATNPRNSVEKNNISHEYALGDFQLKSNGDVVRVPHFCIWSQGNDVQLKIIQTSEDAYTMRICSSDVDTFKALDTQFLMVMRGKVSKTNMVQQLIWEQKAAAMKNRNEHLGPENSNLCGIHAAPIFSRTCWGIHDARTITKLVQQPFQTVKDAKEREKGDRQRLEACKVVMNHMLKYIVKIHRREENVKRKESKLRSIREAWVKKHRDFLLTKSVENLRQSAKARRWLLEMAIEEQERKLLKKEKKSKRHRKKPRKEHKTQNRMQPPQENGTQPPQENGMQPLQNNGMQPPQNNGMQPPQKNGTQPPQEIVMQPPQENGTQPPQKHGTQPHGEHRTQSPQENIMQPHVEQKMQPLQEHRIWPYQKHKTKTHQKHKIRPQSVRTIDVKEEFSCPTSEYNRNVFLIQNRIKNRPPSPEINLEEVTRRSYMKHIVQAQIATTYPNKSSHIS